MTHLPAMLLTLLLSLVFLIALLAFVVRITTLVNAIGGRPTSFLSKLRVGLRAIESETGHLPGLVEGANQELSTTAEGLKMVDQHLKSTLEAATKQERHSQASAAQDASAEDAGGGGQAHPRPGEDAS